MIHAYMSMPFLQRPIKVCVFNVYLAILIHTAKIAFGNTLPIIADQRLREINYGDYNGKPKAEVDAIKLTHLSQPFPNGESYSQAVARVQAFYRKLKAQHPDATPLIIGHRATQFGLDMLVQGKTLEACVIEKFIWQPYWEYEF